MCVTFANKAQRNIPKNIKRSDFPKRNNPALKRDESTDKNEFIVNFTQSRKYFNTVVIA